MAINYVQPGQFISWTNGTGSAVISGQLVKVGNLLGIAMVDIASTAVGTVAIEGVFTVPKVSAAVIAQGEMVIYDVSAAAFDDNAATPATGDVSNGAVAMEAAGNGVTSIAIKLNVQLGTVT